MRKSLALSGLHILCPGAGGSCLGILVTCDAHLHCTGYLLGMRESLGVEEGVNFKCSGLSSQQLPLGAPASTYSFRISFPLLVRKWKERKIWIYVVEKNRNPTGKHQNWAFNLGSTGPCLDIGVKNSLEKQCKSLWVWCIFFLLLPGKRFHKFTKISKESLIQEG